MFGLRFYWLFNWGGRYQMRTILVIGLGSGFGGGLRSLIDLLMFDLGLSTLPVSTFLINVSGSFVIGYLVGLWGNDRVMPADKWHFWVTGFCGGYTTFSAFSWQVIDLLRQGEGTIAGFYAASSTALGLVAVWIGLSFNHRRAEQR